MLDRVGGRDDAICKLLSGIVESVWMSAIVQCCNCRGLGRHFLKYNEHCNGRACIDNLQVNTAPTAFQTFRERNQTAPKQCLDATVRGSFK